MNQLNIVTRWSVVLLLLLFSLAIVQCGGQVRASQNGDIVTVHYTGTLDTGEVFDSSRDFRPFAIPSLSRPREIFRNLENPD